VARAPQTAAAPRARAAPEDTTRLTCRVVGDADERATHAAIRASVFVTEQRIFTGSDADAHDDDPATVHVLGFVDDLPAGAVRLYPVDRRSDGGLWKGDRLAVLPAWRSSGLGAPLVRFAVAEAGARGGTEMIAMVQVPNVRFFVRLGWTPVGEPQNYVGLPHQQMRINLSGG
jgi:putative N-acetyltransferase (TIGR04045 family)